MVDKSVKSKFAGGIRVSTLYVSDLDGTLLGSNEVTSEYTSSVINSLTARNIMIYKSPI